MPDVQVIFHRLAVQEYLSARRWYARYSHRLAQSFREEIGHAVQKIASDPLRWPVYREKYRWVRTRRFPYLLFYYVQDATRVRVMAVAHAKRKPGYWQRRFRL